MKKEEIQEEILIVDVFIRGITVENDKWLRQEQKRLGYRSIGAYLNALAESLRTSDEESRNKVRRKSGS